MSDEYQLKNQDVTVKLTTLGAELMSLTDYEGTEYIWNADEKYWKRHTPILFPIVGKVLEGKYNVGEEEYLLSPHGFARDMTFEVESANTETVTFVLKASPETKAVYPFNFCLKVIYTLKGKVLDIAYEVINQGSETMYFKIGAHPAFMCPLFENETMDDYYLEFEQEEDAVQIPITTEVYLDSKTKEFKGKRIDFKRQLFTDGVIVLTGYKSESISLCSTKHNRKLTVIFKDFPFLGIWRAENDAPFICIEPWHGHADYKDDSQDISNKKDIITLEPGAIFSCVHSVAIS